MTAAARLRYRKSMTDNMSNPQAPEQTEVVERVLGELEADRTPRITVLNKLDRLPPGTRPAAAAGESVALSARTGLGVPDLLGAIDRALLGGRERLEVRIPVHRGGTVLQEVYDDGAVAITALVPPKLAGQIRKAVRAAGPAG